MTRTSWRKYPVDSARLDPNIRRLVAALNGFDGIQTIDSCGGHQNPAPGQWPAGHWCISLKVAHTEEGWRGLEFLAWAVNDDYARSGHDVQLIALSAPPYLNVPGDTLLFFLEGSNGEDADALADWLLEAKATRYISARSRRRGP
jgi:hypothetical protein